MGILDSVCVFDKESPKQNKKHTYINSMYDTDKNIIIELFKDKKKVPKKDFLLLYDDRKTLLGNKLKQNDIFVEILVINTTGILTNNFINISFKYITKQEINDVAKTYTIIDNDRRIPLLVESKYMDSSKYVEYRNKIYKQFL